MPDFNINITSSIVAIYGAAVATVSFVIALYVALRDRSKIKVTFQKGNRVINAEPRYKEGVDYLTIIATNVGRRPVAIDKAVIRVIDKGKPYLMLTDSFRDGKPFVLTEEKPREQFLVEQKLINLDNAWYVAVYDCIGNKYRKFIPKFPILWRVLKFLKTGK